ncbi:rRNA maturation RNase YbeY [Rhodovarius crocodyli]|uniref:Endoribonuclease YbeY n=1 Tax=Rhodovarius crocodyli TaxID=1979269 RepID=A0A437MJF1_9PROT|nr:rRNA maturation RNase YbeY [Rhodovarius crocodyli]RVT97788.1 rRNA maturation RNase YbeY [Rhodovarius crocodyli]
MPDRSSPPEGRSRPFIEIITAAPGWRRLVKQPELLAQRAALAAIRANGVPVPRGAALTVLLADDRTLKQLNSDHRDKVKPTNVLSFPGIGPALGDIAISVETVRREAQAEGKKPTAHFAHLIAHGTLHVLGHDHLEAGEARLMERTESRAMAMIRQPNPWRRT